MYTPSPADLQALAPEIILAIAAGLILLIEAFLPPLRKHLSELTMIVVGVAVTVVPVNASKGWVVTTYVTAAAEGFRTRTVWVSSKGLADTWAPQLADTRGEGAPTLSSVTR